MSAALVLNGRWVRSTHRTIVTAEAVGPCETRAIVCEVFSGGLGIEGADAAEHLIAAAPELLRGLAAACGALQAVPTILRDLGRPSTAAKLEEVLQPLLELLVRAAPKGGAAATSQGARG
jgi:hypothetical protein